MIGAEPRRPPKCTIWPVFLPGTGITRTLVVLLFATPIASSSAIIALSISGGVSPGTANMSRPTEHTLVSASSLSRLSEPFLTARIIPMSSLTGMKVPLSPPTFPDAIAPPFFTASISSASAAVEPGLPVWLTPIASRISATESPAAVVLASEISTIPKSTFIIFAISLPMSSPARVILKTVRFITSES